MGGNIFYFYMEIDKIDSFNFSPLRASGGLNHTMPFGFLISLKDKFLVVPLRASSCFRSYLAISEAHGAGSP